MANPDTIKSYKAGGAIGPNLCVKFSASGTVVQSAAAADLSIGVSVPLMSAALGDRVDVIHEAIADVLAGGVCTRGTAVTSDANGAVVNAVAGNRAVGIALETAAAGDIIPVLIQPATA